MSGQTLLIVLNVFALGWNLSVMLHYAIYQDSERTTAITRWLIQEFSVPSLLVLILQMAAIPVLLVFGLKAIKKRVRTCRSRAMITGTFLGTWANATFLLIAYLGAYPSIVGASIAYLMTGGPNVGPPFYFTTFAVNLFAYVVIALFVFGREQDVGESRS